MKNICDLPKDNMITIGYNLKPHELLYLCSTNKKCAELCQSQKFWSNKLKYDYPYVYEQQHDESDLELYKKLTLGYGNLSIINFTEKSINFLESNISKVYAFGNNVYIQDEKNNLMYLTNRNIEDIYIDKYFGNAEEIVARNIIDIKHPQGTYITAILDNNKTLYKDRQVIRESKNSLKLTNSELIIEKIHDNVIDFSFVGFDLNFITNEHKLYDAMTRPIKKISDNAKLLNNDFWVSDDNILYFGLQKKSIVFRQFNKNIISLSVEYVENITEYNAKIVCVVFEDMTSITYLLNTIDEGYDIIGEININSKKIIATHDQHLMIISLDNILYKVVIDQNNTNIIPLVKNVIDYIPAYDTGGYVISILDPYFLY